MSQHADRSRAKEDQPTRLGHAYKQHVDITDAQLQQRLANGLENATRWTSDAAAVTANALIWANPVAQRRRQEIEDKLKEGKPVNPKLEVRASLAQIFGPDWRDHVDGLSRSPAGTIPTPWGTDGRVIAVYKRQGDGEWHLTTCFPEPKQVSDP